MSAVYVEVRRLLNTLELESQEAVSHVMWVLETKLWVSLQELCS